jgi:hypothetical protein
MQIHVSWESSKQLSNVHGALAERLEETKIALWIQSSFAALK